MLHSKQWHYSLHRDFQNCYSTRRSPTEFFSSYSTRVPIHHTSSTYNLHVHITLHYNPENSPSRIQFYMQKTESSSSTTTTYRGQRDLHSRKKFYTQKARRASGYSSVCYKDIQTFQPFQAILQILQCSSISRESTPFQHSPIRMHILQFDWFPQKTPPSTS